MIDTDEIKRQATVNGLKFKQLPIFQQGQKYSLEELQEMYPITGKLEKRCTYRPKGGWKQKKSRAKVKIEELEEETCDRRRNRRRRVYSMESYEC